MMPRLKDLTARLRQEAEARARARGFPSVEAMLAADQEAEQAAARALLATGWRLDALPPELRDAGRRVLALREQILAAQEALARKFERMRADASYAYLEVARELVIMSLTRDPGPAVWRAVDRALGETRDPKDRRRKDPLAQHALQDPSNGYRDRLARALVGHLNRLPEALALWTRADDGTWIVDAPDPVPEQDGMLAMDARFADYLDAMGDEGSRLAAIVRRKAQERWTAYQAGELDPPGRLLRLWLNLENEPRAPWLVLLAHAVWQDEVRPALEREERFRPALQIQHLEELGRALWAPDRTVVPARNGSELLIRDARAAQVARFPVANPRLLARLQAELLTAYRCVDFLRVFGAILARGHQERARNPGRVRLTIPEGITGLYKLAHVGDFKNVRRALEFGQCIILDLPSLTAGGLWTWWVEREPRFGGPRSYLYVEPASWLLPPRVGQHLVPVLPPDREPGLPSQHKLHGDALLVAQRLLAWMREQAAELALHGHVPLDDAAWRALGRAVGVEGKPLDSIRGALLQGDSRGRPPLLKVPVPGRADLSDHYADIRAFLIEGGRRTLTAREAGRKGARKRWSGGCRGRGRGRRRRGPDGR